MRILVDSSAWLGLEDPDDNRHDAAVSCWQQLEGKPNRYLLSSWLFSETLTLVSRRLGVERAYILGRRLLDSTQVEIIQGDPILESQAMLVMRSRKEPGFSFTDAASWVIARSHDIDAIFAFDRHLRMPGIRLLPEDAVDRVREKKVPYRTGRPRLRRSAPAKKA